MLTSEDFEHVNPFGPIDERELEKIEEDLGTQLPHQYRRNLYNFNGAKFRKVNFRRSDDPYVTASIQLMFGIHTGPDQYRFQDNYPIRKYFDISDFDEDVSEFCNIGRSGTGYSIMISILSGSIFKFSPNDLMSDSPGGLNDAFEYLAPDFDAFAESLLSDDEYTNTDPDGDDDEEWLREMIKLGRVEP